MKFKDNDNEFERSFLKAIEAEKHNKLNYNEKEGYYFDLYDNYYTFMPEAVFVHRITGDLYLVDCKACPPHMLDSKTVCKEANESYAKRIKKLETERHHLKVNGEWNDDLEERYQSTIKELEFEQSGSDWNQSIHKFSQVQQYIERVYHNNVYFVIISDEDMERHPRDNYEATELPNGLPDYLSINPKVVRLRTINATIEFFKKEVKQVRRLGFDRRKDEDGNGESIGVIDLSTCNGHFHYDLSGVSIDTERESFELITPNGISNLPIEPYTNNLVRPKDDLVSYLSPKNERLVNCWFNRTKWWGDEAKKEIREEKKIISDFYTSYGERLNGLFSHEWYEQQFKDELARELEETSIIYNS